MQTLRIVTRASQVGLLTLVAFTCAPSASAQTRPPAITFAQAEAIARAYIPDASVESIQLEHKRGRRVYEVELRTSEGDKYEVMVDASDGSIVRATID